MTLKNVSDAQLKAELAERERKKQAEPLPKPLAKPDFSKLEEFIKDGVKHVAEEGYAQKGFAHYAYEAAMEAVFGRKIWDWYNKANRSRD